MSDEANSGNLPDIATAVVEAAAFRENGRATINDIARIARVSKKTVSRVINRSPLVKLKTRELVEAIIDELGFIPDPQARALALRRSFLIGLVYDNPSPQYVVNMQRGILDCLEDTDFQLVLRPCDRAEPRYRERVAQFVQQHRPYGVILTPSVSEDEELAGMLRDLGVDYVRIASVVLDTPARMIHTHDALGAAEAARHLTVLGHTGIAHIHGPNTFRSAHERRRGFVEGLAESGVTLAPDRTIEAGYTFESGQKAANVLLNSKDMPTAIFAGNDEMATGVYVALRRAGLRIPEDVSIVGFDDTPIAGRLWPGLTTVRLPIREMGRRAAQLLVDPAASEGFGEPVSFTPELVVRESTNIAPRALRK